MKILQVAPILDPDNLWTGPHRVVFDISKRLSEMGNKVTVCTSDMLNKTEMIKGNPQSSAYGFEIVRVKNINQPLYRASGLLITPELGRFLREHVQDYDIIHLHEYRTYQNIVVHTFAKKHGIPYVVQAHGALARIGRQASKWAFDAFFGYRLLNDASRVIALTKTEAQQYKSAGVSEERIKVIPNGINLLEYRDLPPKGSFKKRFKIRDDAKIILYLGRIHRTKGINLLIAAFAYMIKKMKKNNILLVIAGPDDGYLLEAQSLVNSLGIAESVVFAGFIDTQEKLALLKDADLFITPSFHGFPITFLEACAVGTPVVTTTLGDLLEWINGNVGYVTSPTNYGIAQAASNILSDSEIARGFSQNCRKIVESVFSIENVVNMLEKLYNQVASVNEKC
jgi:glycosyltransferase involved in cell wall biosynthesis